MFLTLSICLQLLTAGFELQQSLPTQASSFVVDDLGNTYFIFPTHIESVTAEGALRYRTSELNFGNIEFLDVTNPLKPFIHYKDIGQLVIFDNTLSRIGSPVDLYEKGWGQIEYVAGSRGDAYWFWDSRNSELIRVDNNFRKLNSSGNLSVLLGKKIVPVQIIERGSYLYLRDETHGIFVFDIYGSYKTLLNLKTEKDIQVRNDEIIYTRKDALVVLERNWLSEAEYPLPDVQMEQVAYFDKKLYTLESGVLKVWKWKEKQK